MKSYEVRFWEVRKKKGRRRPYEVRWLVAGRQKSRSFLTRALADSSRSQLVQAARRGEAFDVESGLPESVQREQSAVTWFEHACDYIDAKWSKSAAKSRVSLVEGMTAVTLALVKTERGAPDAVQLRRALRKWAFNPSRRNDDQPEQIASALRWLRTVSVPISALQETNVLGKSLDACAIKLDGKPAAPEYYRRRRRVFYNALRYAVRLRRLSANPLDDVGDAEWQPPEVVEQVDPRRVANPAQVRALLSAIGSVGRTQGPRLVALFGCMYYGMLRPSEAVAVREQDCKLPATGWGQLLVGVTRSAAGREWTDDGEVHETRGLKGRPRKTVRPVPIPPELVRLLRDHIAEHGAGPDGRLFRTYRGGVFQPSTLWQVLRKARPKAFSARQAGSPLAARPYDFRHAGVSLRLNAGTPATQVAEWAGHSVEVLLKVYAHCLHGQDHVWYERIDDALRR